MADVLLQYGQHMEGDNGQLAGKYSLAEASVACDVHAWLTVVAKHVDFGKYV